MRNITQQEADLHTENDELEQVIYELEQEVQKWESWAAKIRIAIQKDNDTPYFIRDLAIAIINIYTTRRK